MKVDYTTFSLQKRLLVLVILIAFVFCAVAVRLFFLQGLTSADLNIKAAPQWARSLPLAAARGDITDTTGSTLATSYTLYDVYVRARNVKNAAEVADFLSKTLGLNFDSVYQKAINVSISEVLIKMDVDQNTANKIINANLEGVVLGEDIGRYYPYGNSMSQILGFTSVDNVGQAGLEAYYNSLLAGINGYALNQADVKGLNLDGSLNYYVPGISGLNLQLTVDSKIQTIAENVLNQIMADHSPQNATMIVMDPNTGAILAMAKTPSLDPNNLPRDNVQQLLALTKNSMVTDVYEPGSTFKILTISAALDSGVTSLSDQFYCPGYRIVDGQKIKCWRTIGHGNENLVEGFVNSCNCVFMDLAQRLGTDRFYSYLQKFGIGSPTNIDISGESTGILLNKNNVQTVDLARIGFGQTVAVTQIQLISAFCAAVNGGTLYQPYLVKDIYNNQGQVVQSTTPTIQNKPISAATSQTVNYLLSQAVNKSGPDTFVEGYDVGGKTGTAQKYANGVIDQGAYVSSFFGVYPTASNPQYAVLLCVDEPSSGAYYGSVVAAPYAQMFFQQLFDYEGIAKDEPGVVVGDVVMPNLIGYSLSAAQIALDNLGISYEISGSGGTITAQTPVGNTTIKMNTTVLIST